LTNHVSCGTVKTESEGDMNSHTPEPWEHGEGSYIVSPHPIYNGDDSNTWYKDTDGNPKYLICESVSGSNAVRIISCVNACAGMEDPAAEIAALKERQNTLLSDLDLAEHKLGKLRADNKVLRDALEKMQKLDVTGMTYFDGYYQLNIMIDEALDKKKEAGQ
jgi:hypothetical protein